MKNALFQSFLLLALLGGSAFAAESRDYSYRVYSWEDSRFQFGLGPTRLMTKESALSTLALALRYRLSPQPWPLSEDKPWRLGPLSLNLFVETGAITPFGSANLGDQTVAIDATTTDFLHTKLRYQMHAALINQFPIGKQRKILPELGLGLTASSLKHAVDSRMSNGITTFEDHRSRRLGPYFSAGLHLWPDHVASLFLRGSYIALPKVESLNMQTTPSPHQTPLTPLPSAWTLQAQLRLKVLWPRAKSAPLVPQLMPPWLLPAYTTEEISPWIAPAEIANRADTKVSGGNVFFQYKNRWASTVELVGDFNDWTPEKMTRDRSGIWVAVRDLQAGRYRYRYLVDGKKEITDPWNSATENLSSVFEVNR